MMPARGRCPWLRPWLAAQFYSPAELIMIDLDDNRLARRFGATNTSNSSDGKAAGTVRKLIGARGVDKGDRGKRQRGVHQRGGAASRLPLGTFCPLADLTVSSLQLKEHEL
jgi:hypothetical protein